MDKDRHTISATELSKFRYCPYQWYYERVYGRKKLRRLALERNERLGLEDSSGSRIAKGLDYHDKHYRMLLRKKRIAIVILILAVVAVYAAVKKGGML